MGIAAVGGGVPGAVLGGIIGWRMKADVWQDVPLGTHRVGISPVVTPRGVGLGLRF